MSKDKIKPVINKVDISITQSDNITSGMVTLATLDKDGNEIEGKDFEVNARTYNKTYKQLPNFKVKKNPR